MKKTLLTLTSIASFGLVSIAQDVNIPDANFKSYLVGNTSINTNADSEIQVSEAFAYAGQINCTGLGVSDLTGLEAFTEITSFWYIENYLTSIDLSQNTALTSIVAYYSYSLTSLNLSQNIALTSLDLAYSTNLSNLNVTQNSNLTGLYVVDNSSLSTLDISQNTSLVDFDCRGCNLSSLDVSQNLALQYLDCQGNNLSFIDVTQNTALKQFACFENNLTVLDISQNTALTYFQCFDNNLTVLNMKNISTTSLSQIAAGLNPNLICIDVDDVALATAAWTNIDPSSSFSLNCVVDLVNSITVQGQSGVSSIAIPGGTLQMNANVMPTYADDNTYTWSVMNGTGSASISAIGELTALADGDITIIATANDASGVTGSTVISITNQSVGISEGTNESWLIYPNPTKSQLTIDSDTKFQYITITNMIGEVVERFGINNNSIDVSSLKPGVYFIQIQIGKTIATKKFIKE